MRYQGKISQWNDTKGFGFVTPTGGSARAFVHIKSIGRRSRRPVDGDVISYELTKDSKGRANAINVRYPREKIAQWRKSPGNWRGYVAITLLGLCVTILTASNQLPLEILFAYIFFSGITFLAYAFDKAAAMKDRWRTRENTLHLLSLLGGWPGALVAQNMFRHKTKKAGFRALFWFTVLTNCGLLFWFTTASGSGFLQAVL